MPPSILEKPQEISNKNLNIVGQSAPKELLCVVSKPQYLSDLEKKQEEVLLHLDEKTKKELKIPIYRSFNKFLFLI